MTQTPALQASEKIFWSSLGEDVRQRLSFGIQMQVNDLVRLRECHPLLDLESAVRFDPRIPGKVYPKQTNAMSLSKTDQYSLPDSEAEIANASVNQQGHWLHTHQISSLELTEIYLDRIRRFDARVNAFITVTEDLALAQARARDEESSRGVWRGPLHGIPYTLKDVIDTRGIATTYGSALFRNRVPTEDATVVSKLREAGAVLLGKVATGELAWGATWFGGEVRNPWSLGEAAGGSSGGSAAAVAAGLCVFSIASDSLGSILNPADRCGVVGLRPTFGRVSARGCLPVAPTLTRIGPLCRQVEDAAIILAAINGIDRSSANSLDVGFTYDARLNPRDLRIGYSPSWFENVGFDTGGSASSATRKTRASQGHWNGLHALRDLGVQLIEVELERLPYANLGAILYVESAAIFKDMLQNGDADRLIAPWAEKWRNASRVSAIEYLEIERFRRQVMILMDRLFDKVDMLLAPTYGNFDLLLITNCTGHPGLTFRTGFAESPVRDLMFTPPDSAAPKHRVTTNLAMHGRLFEEGKMIALARALEQSLGAWKEPPPLQ